MKNIYVNPAVKFVAALFLLFSCSKMEQESSPQEERPSWLQLSSSADVRLQPLLDSIWHHAHHRLVLDSILSNFGLVRWEKGMTGYRGETLVALVPLSLGNASSMNLKHSEW